MFFFFFNKCTTLGGGVASSTVDHLVSHGNMLQTAPEVTTYLICACTSLLCVSIEHSVSRSAMKEIMR